MVRLTTLALFEMFIIVASFQDRSEYKQTPAVQRGKSGKTKRFIVNGQDAIPHEFPWTVYIAIEDKIGDSYSCTGSLISPRIVLTAAHCIKNLSRIEQDIFDARLVGIFPGWHKNPAKEMLKRDVYELDVAPLHSCMFAAPPLPKQHYDYSDYDYSVIILHKPLERNKTIQFIKFADGSSPPAKSLVCYTAGFGDVLNENSTVEEYMKNASDEEIYNYALRITPNVLQKLRYKILSTNRCYERIRRKYLEFEDWTEQEVDEVMEWYDIEIRKGSLICGLQARPASGFCEGDSGGPLMCKSQSGQWILYGVVTASLGKCTDVSLFQGVVPISGWLKKMIAKYDPEYRPEFSTRGEGAKGFQAVVKAIGRIRWNYRIAVPLKTKSGAKRD